MRFSSAHVSVTQFQSADDLNPPSPTRGLERQHVSAPDLSSLRVRSAAPPPPRLVAPPPPRQPPPKTGDIIYDEPRPAASVSADRLLEEVICLRRDNHQLRQMVRRTQTAGGEREEQGERGREERLRATRRQAERLTRETDQLTGTNRRLEKENRRLRAEPDRQVRRLIR